MKKYLAYVCAFMLPFQLIYLHTHNRPRRYPITMYQMPAEVDLIALWTPKIEASKIKLKAQLEAAAAAELAARQAPRKRSSNYGSGVAPGGIWSCIRQHESGNDYGDGNGGAYQFLDSTWDSMDGKQ